MGLLPKNKYPSIDYLQNKPFGRQLIDIRMYMIYNGTDITFQELLSNGKLDLIRNQSLKIAIQNHYNKIKEEKTFQRVIEQARDGFVDCLIANGISMTNNDNFAILKDQVKGNKKLLANLYNILSLTRAIHSRFYIKENATKNSTENLLLEIEKYLHTLN